MQLSASTHDFLVTIAAERSFHVANICRSLTSTAYTHLHTMHAPAFLLWVCILFEGVGGSTVQRGSKTIKFGA